MKATPQSEREQQINNLPSITFVGWPNGYVSNKSRALVRCDVCDHNWSAIITNLIRGRGCPECAHKKRKATKTTSESECLSRIGAVAAGKYQVVGWVGSYAGLSTKARCVCNVCGHKWESTSANKLISGQGCKPCVAERLSANSRTPEADVIKRVNGLEGVVFLRWKTSYRNGGSKAVCRCPKGHEWAASPADLYGGSRCPECAGVRHKSEQEWVDLINSREGIRFIRWRGSSRVGTSLVVVGCQYGHEWSVRPASFISKGSGCPDCAEYGYSNSKPGTLYALRSACGRLVKVGISNDPKTRLARLYRATPFKFKAVMMVKCEDGGKIAKLEKDLHARMVRADFGAEKFDGYTEWMEWDPALLGWLKEFEANSCRLPA